MPPKKGGTSGSASTGTAPKPADFMPNISDKWDFLPGVKRWNGIPFHDFTTFWFAALIVALGSIVQSGNTLLECAESNDEGRDNGDSEDSKAAHKVRKHRLYASIMNYIHPNSRIYRIAKKDRHIVNNGPALFKWLEKVGQLDLDADTKERLLHEFEESTMAKVTSFTPDAIFIWLNYIDELGDKLGKSLNQKRRQFLAGFPESFDVVVSAERLKPDPGSYIIAANYPAHHPMSGQPRDDGLENKPDLDALTDALWPEWNRRIQKGLIKSPPRGSVYAVECESDDEDNDNVDETTMMHANAVSRNKVTARTVCIVCGGLGHASNVDGMACLTTQLNNRVSKDELRQIKYPNGITFPDFDRRNGKSTRYVRSSAREVVDESPPVEAQRLHREPRNRSKPHTSRKPGKQYSHHRKPRKVREVQGSPSQSDDDQSESQESDTAPEAKYASVYHTIDVRHTKYESYSSSSSSDSERRITKSATTKAKTK